MELMPSFGSIREFIPFAVGQRSLEWPARGEEPRIAHLLFQIFFLSRMTRPYSTPSPRPPPFRRTVSVATAVTANHGSRLSLLPLHRQTPVRASPPPPPPTHLRPSVLPSVRHRSCECRASDSLIYLCALTHVDGDWGLGRGGAAAKTIILSANSFSILDDHARKLLTQRQRARATERTSISFGKLISRAKWKGTSKTGFWKWWSIGVTIASVDLFLVW